MSVAVGLFDNWVTALSKLLSSSLCGGGVGDAEGNVDAVADWTTDADTD